MHNHGALAGANYSKEQLKQSYLGQEMNAKCESTEAFDPQTIPNVFKMLEANRLRASNLSSRLAAANNYIAGVRPTPPETNGATSPIPNGAVETMNGELREMAVILDWLDVEVRRLERVVG